MEMEERIYTLLSPYCTLDVKSKRMKTHQEIDETISMTDIQSIATTTRWIIPKSGHEVFFDKVSVAMIHAFSSAPNGGDQYDTARIAIFVQTPDDMRTAIEATMDAGDGWITALVCCADKRLKTIFNEALMV